MRLLLDTHTFLWWMTDDPRLTQEARYQIANHKSFVAISAAVVWEISIKSARGKLEAVEDLEEQVEKQGFAPLPIHIGHAIRAGALPALHRDPFDRMLVAQAQIEGMTIVTRDENIARYDVGTLAA